MGTPFMPLDVTTKRATVAAVQDQEDDLPEWMTPIIGAETAKLPTTRMRAAVTAGAGSYVSLLRNLVRSSGVYALAAMAAPLISLVLAPFLAHQLSPVDYGVLTILNTAIALGAGISQLGLGSAFFRAYSFDFTTKSEQRGVVATVIFLVCLVSAPLALAGVAFAPQVAALLLSRPQAASLVALALGVMVLQNLTMPAFAWLRAESRSGIFAALSVVNLLVALAGNIVLVGVLRWGVAGSLLATGAAYGLVALVTLPPLLVWSRLCVQRQIIRSLLAFGLPLVLNFTSYWALQLSDRYLLSRLGSLTQVAGYAVAYSLGTVLSTVVIAPFTLAWPTAMYAIAKRADAAQVFRLVFRWFSFLLLFAGYAFALLATAVLGWLFPVSYQSAAGIIPIITASIVCYGAYIVVMLGANVRRKTWLAAVFTTFAAVLNVVLNLLLIPRLGSMGAALATLIAYAVMLLAAYIVNQRIYPVPYEVGRCLLAALAGVGIYAGGHYLAGQWGAQWTWPLAGAGLALYALWLFMSSVAFRPAAPLVLAAAKR